jgi:PIN domain nuclease of toxin-antitoxin system
VNVLLDTHVALWAITASPRLSKQAREIIAAPENAIYVSAASLWEIAIKHALKRRGAGAMPISATQAHEYFIAAGYVTLPITPQHVASVETLPPLHADPFDRMLVAQAASEPLHLMTHDADLAAYGAHILVV